MVYADAIHYLYSSRPPFHMVGKEAYKPGLETTLRLMEHVGNPHTQLSTIHIAGTNGKGSTSHLIAAVLQQAGYKVGLFTSPHLVDLTERIRVNGQPIEQTYVCDFIEQNRAFLDEKQPSFFETMTAMAFSYFVAQKVQIAVVEVGLGGRLDSTNIITPLLSVITNIGIDHTEFLGETLPQIAKEKAGIIKPNTPCVIGETHPETEQVFLSHAQECGILGAGLETTNCRIWFADQCGFMRKRRMREAPECELKGAYQEKNMQTAYVALQALRNCTHIQLSASHIQQGFAQVCTLTGLRGRWEILSQQPLLICDTAHNSHGIRYVAEQLNELSVKQLWIVFGMVADKDIDEVLRLMPTHARYIFTTPTTQRAMPAQEMAERWCAIHPEQTPMTIPQPQEAIQYALTHASKEDAIFIGGSNYLVGEAIRDTTTSGKP